MFHLNIKPSDEKQLDRLTSKVRARITKAVDGLCDNPRPPDCVNLQGEDDLSRIRVGDYRVVYAIRDAVLVVLVVRVAHRKDVYRG